MVALHSAELRQAEAVEIPSCSGGLPENPDKQVCLGTSVAKTFPLCLPKTPQSRMPVNVSRKSFMFSFWSVMVDSSHQKSNPEENLLQATN
jgi:hypothetical protein